MIGLQQLVHPWSRGVDDHREALFAARRSLQQPAVTIAAKPGDRSHFANVSAIAASGFDDRAHQRRIIDLRVPVTEPSAQPIAHQRRHLPKLLRRTRSVSPDVGPSGQEVVQRQADCDHESRPRTVVINR